MNRRRTRYPLKPSEISLTPLIDTAFTLLIIFMITAPAINNNIHINLPSGKSKEIHEAQELVITLQKDGLIYFNSFPVSISELTQSVQTALKEFGTIPVFIRADESIHYGTVMNIIDELKCAGVTSIGMSMRATVPTKTDLKS